MKTKINRPETLEDIQDIEDFENALARRVAAGEIDEEKAAHRVYMERILRRATN